MHPEPLDDCSTSLGQGGRRMSTPQRFHARANLLFRPLDELRMQSGIDIDIHDPVLPAWARSATSA
jgi:hypothetical protein